MNLEELYKFNAMKLGEVVTHTEQYEIMMEITKPRLGHVRGFLRDDLNDEIMVAIDWGTSELIYEYITNIRTLTEKVRELDPNFKLWLQYK